MINPYEKMKMRELHNKQRMKEVDASMKAGLSEDHELYYDRQSKPIDLLQWSELFKDKDYRVVSQQYLSPNLLVSTVWLGLNHNFRDGEPEVFETMIFGKTDKDGFREDLEMERYATEAEAIAGHRKYMAKYTQYLKDNKTSLWKSISTGISNRAKKWLSISKKQ
jgi:hypothetical protein